MARKPAERGGKRYEQVAEALIAEIRSGRRAVGETLPGELELARLHGVSRHTVREALRRLEALGLIGRRQGVGTVVKSRQPTPSYVQTVRSPAELLQYPPDSRLAVLASAELRLPRRVAARLGAPAGSRWFRIRCLRRLRESRLPVCWVDVYLLPEFAPIADLIGRRAQPVYEMIEQRFHEKVAGVEVDIRAGLVPEEMQGPLGVGPGTPSLAVIRRYRDAERRLLEVTVSEHPADRYTYSLQLTRGWQSGAAGWSPR